MNFDSFEPCQRMDPALHLNFPVNFEELFIIFSFLVHSRREPEEPEDATKGRDVFNEKPPPDELLAASDIGKAVTTSLPDNVVSFPTCFKLLSPEQIIDSICYPD